MLHPIAATLLLLQQVPAQAPPPALPPAPVARVAITPSPLTVTAGDTLRIRAIPYDEAGKPIMNARLRFVQAGAAFEGKVDTAGLVTSGATGTLPVAVVVLMEGYKPYVERMEVRMLPGPAARVAIAPKAPAKLVAGQRIHLTATPYSAAGDRRDNRITWRSSAPAVAKVADDGLVTAVAPGHATLTASAGAARETVELQVVATTIASIVMTPARADARTGDVLRFTATPRDAAGRTIAGLTPSWSMSPGNGQIDPDGTFVGYEAGQYTVTASFGGRSADATITLARRDVRRAATVVGRLPRSQFTTEEVWVHPNGKVAYLGTGSGGDRMYAIDISDPAKPVVTDSIVANTRRVNDIMTDRAGKFLVFTREGAADRKNGIVIASIEDPLHPKPIAEYTQGVTAGVHSAFVYTDPKHGTHIFLTNDGTNALHVLNVDDPAKPREVAVFKGVSASGGGALHDIDVQDGMLYASWWNDGLVILDVGNGIKGGSPSNPVVVSQYKYDLNLLYHDVEVAGGPGFIRGTHTAWRHRNYVFIADEVFPSRPVQGAKDASAFRAYGRLQVIDVSDIAKPRSVAWYEPEFGGVHNVWVAGDTLYLGAYNGGFRAFDVSGELRGDLRAQGREMAHVNTADMDGNVKNAAMTWGVVVKDGLAYVNDMFNGLWIVRMEPRREVVP
ncbi:MAG TPA: Ig-like domain-containing protein [Gemmatimonadaceae bacterium]|nr:Ig-like domain-containing protein [Gemmatimonadaceae bacterium]